MKVFPLCHIRGIAVGFMLCCWFHGIAAQEERVADSVDYNQYFIVLTEEIHEQQWDTLQQVQFWKYIMQLHKDTGLLNVKSTREVLRVMPVEEWSNLPDSMKQVLKDGLKLLYGLDEEEELFFTPGKQHYYSIPKVLPCVTKAVDIFLDNCVDPFYAQAILLIESPVKVHLSNAGAYGQFQLMQDVAIKAGLKIDSCGDERTDFEKSAKATAYLMRTLYIPATNKILGQLDIEYDETALWYKLLVLHTYHAGAYNVKKAIQHAGVKEGSNELITTLWKTHYRQFGNASQNYTQLVIAAHLAMEDYLRDHCWDDYYCW